MKLRIDLNADLGEGAGQDADLLRLVTSANVACGFHAGDPSSIRETLEAAREASVSVGAHPSLADREGFGRRELEVTPAEASALVSYQIGAFAALARAAGLRPNHVKLHGALYNMAARDPVLAGAVCRAIVATDRTLVLFAPPDSALARASEQCRLRVAREFFADRQYLADGSLVPRSRPDALIHDPSEATDRVLGMLRTGLVQAATGEAINLQAETVCIHGDNPDALSFARFLRSSLLEAGVAVAAISGEAGR